MVSGPLGGELKASVDAVLVVLNSLQMLQGAAEVCR